MSRPAVSVVVATYNASHVLRYALSSLRRQTLSNWEAIVVGDACTDDTEDVVAGLGDPRIRFVNLEQNSGQQATPNNVGVGLARADAIAFLNHDDLFLPEHLEKSLSLLAERDAQLVVSPVAEVPIEESDALDRDEIRVRLAGFASDGRFDPRRFHVTSSWTLRRAFADRVGPWRLEHETFVTPSQDWLFRAWRTRARIVCPEDATVIAIYAGQRRDFYRRKQTREHAFFHREVIETGRLRFAFDRALAESRESRRAKRPEGYRRGRKRGWARLRRKVARRFERLLMICGVHPNAPRMFFRHGGRGGYIRAIKRRTG